MPKRTNNNGGYACVTAAFDPFGAGPMPKPQDMMGSFLGPGNMGQPDPFLHAARSPSPTLQPTSLGKACFCCSAAHSLRILDSVNASHIGVKCVVLSRICKSAAALLHIDVHRACPLVLTQFFLLFGIHTLRLCKTEFIFLYVWELIGLHDLQPVVEA